MGHGRRDQTGRYGIDADTVSGVVDSALLGQADNTSLASSVCLAGMVSSLSYCSLPKPREAISPMI